MSLLFKITSSLFKKNKTAKICFIGLDSAGKSSIIKKIVEDEFNENQDKRTLGMSVEKIAVAGLNFITWDLGGQKAFRDSLWPTYMKGTRGVIYVIDSSDHFRLSESRKEINKFIFENPNFYNIPILILANKQDKFNAMTVNEISDYLNLYSKKNKVKIFPVSCKTGLNLSNAMKWLADEVNDLSFSQESYHKTVFQTINI